MPIKFNPENKTSLTIGECLGPAMEITDEAEAKQYFRDYVAFIQHDLDVIPRPDSRTAEDIARHNLGYYAGYCSDETRARVERLFVCVHPIFGPITKNGPPTAKEAFEAGKQMAAKH